MLDATHFVQINMDVETQQRCQPVDSAGRFVAKNPFKKKTKKRGFTKPCKYQQKIDLCCPALQIVWKMNRAVSGLKSKNVEIPTNQVDSCAKKGAFSKGSLMTP